MIAVSSTSTSTASSAEHEHDEEQALSLHVKHLPHVRFDSGNDRHHRVAGVDVDFRKRWPPPLRCMAWLCRSSSQLPRNELVVSIAIRNQVQIGNEARAFRRIPPPQALIWSRQRAFQIRGRLWICARGPPIRSDRYKYRGASSAIPHS